MSTVELAGSAVLPLISTHLPSDLGSLGLTHYGTSVPLGSFAHGKRTFPQQGITCATTTGQLMSVGVKAVWLGARKSWAWTWSPDYSLASLRLGKRLRSGKTAVCHKKEERRKELGRKPPVPLPLDLVSGSHGHSYAGMLACTCQPFPQQGSKLSFSLLKHDSVQLLWSILLLSHGAEFSALM